MIFRRLDSRTVVALMDDHETEIMRVVLPEGGATTDELMKFTNYLLKQVAGSKAQAS